MSCNIYFYAVLAIVSNSYPPLPGRLPTRYSPVRNSSKKSKLFSSAFYLHVLGTPPAFVLSQDQTLIKSLSSHSFLSLTDLLFFSLFSTITSVIVPCTLVRLVQFSKVFVTLSLSSDNYISISQLLTFVNTFLKLFLLFSSLRYTHSPYGIRTRVTAVKRRCLNPLTNGPYL